MEVEYAQKSQDLECGANPNAFNITFVDVHERLVSAWQDEIAKQLPSQVAAPSTRSVSVSTHLGSFQSFLESAPVDCMVSPANSFGLMDGGIDLHISKYYGGVVNLVPVVRAALVDEWCGEQNVGTCLIVDVHELVERAKQGDRAKNVPRYIAHVPTMRVPKVLQPEDDLPYRCTWALLTAVRRHNTHVARQRNGGGHGDVRPARIRTVLCAGFGTGVGQFPHHECARQMVLAVKHFVEKTAKYDARASPADSQADTPGLMTLWDEAEKIEDAVCSVAAPERS